MDTERVLGSRRPARSCRRLPVAVRTVSAADAVAGVVPSFVASPAQHRRGVGAAAGRGRGRARGGAARRRDRAVPGAPPPSACDLVVDLRSMDQVIEHAAGDLVARVQAGATIGQLAAVLGSAGQQLALDVPAEATVGGVVATGTAGPRRFRYGAPRDLLIGITVVRADGVVAHAGGKVVKNVAGYDLGKLFAGSQGTLGADHRGDVPAASAAGRGGVGDGGVRPGRAGRAVARWRRRRVRRWCRRRWSWTGRAGRSGRCASGCCSRAPRPGWPNEPSRCPSCWRRRAGRWRSPRRRPRRWGAAAVVGHGGPGVVLGERAGPGAGRGGRGGRGRRGAGPR